MKVAILDDWHDTLRHLPCFSKLDGHDIEIWTDHAADEDVLAGRLADAEALVLIRERTRITGRLLDRLPRLRLISQRSVYPMSTCRAAPGTAYCSARTCIPTRPPSRPPS